MQPIVNRLEDDYNGRLVFAALNAETDGAEAFEKAALPGHPGFLIYLPEGKEYYRSFGIVSENALRDEIEAALGE